MRLSEFVDVYALSRDIRTSSVSFYRYEARRFIRDLGRDPEPGELDDRQLNEWLAKQIAAGANRTTLRTVRGAILTLLRAAYDDGLSSYLPGRVREVSSERKPTQAWTYEEANRVLAAAQLVPGYFNGCGIKRSLLLRALFRTAWDSAMRPGDLLARKASELRPNGLLRWAQNKTGKEHRVVLSPATMEAIHATYPPERERLFPIGRKALAYWLPEIRKAAGVPGSMKWFRRSAATSVEIDQEGAGWKLLGHSGPDLARVHYLDMSQIVVTTPQARPLVG